MTGHRPFADLKKNWNDDRQARHHARRTFDPAELMLRSVAELVGMRSG